MLATAGQSAQFALPTVSDLPSSKTFFDRCTIRKFSSRCPIDNFVPGPIAIDTRRQRDSPSPLHTDSPSSSGSCTDPVWPPDDIDDDEEEWEKSGVSSKCVIAPLTDEEMEYLERAHVKSKLLAIYKEPSLRFITVPKLFFATPLVSSGESGYHSESSPPVVLDARPSFVPSPAVASSSSSGSKPKDLCDIKTSTSAAASCSSTSKPPTPPPTSALDRAGHFEVSKMDVLSEEIWHYHNSVTQTETMLNLKLHLRDLLYYAISPVFPMCGLYVVGSSLNGFGNNSSDMDLCLMITNKDLDQKTDAVVVLNMILNAVAQLEWVASQKLILAKVPILRIKFTAPFAKITVDLNANNSVAIKNTHLLCYYSSFDWRVRPLVSVVKEWAKRKGINDANRSSFTSYSLVLMVIHYLQCGAEPRVLPSLQQLYPKIFSSKCDVRTLNVTQTLPTPSEDWEYSEKLTLGELLIGFLDYYANKFDYDHHAISVRQGKRVDRAALTRARPAGAAGANAGAWRSQWRCICIEEPFTLSNTAHSIYDEMVFGAIKQAFSEAHLELEQTRDLQTLLSCQSIKVSMPMGGAVVYSTNYETSRATTSEAIPSVPNGLPDMNLMPSISANSLNTAHSGSSASSSNGDEVEPDSERLPFPSAISPSSSSRRSSGRNSGKRKNRRPDVNNLHSTAVRT